jgi:hypothetical protein
VSKRSNVKLTLTMRDGSVRSLTVTDGADCAVAEGVCPECGEPLLVQGAGKHIESHDTYAADGYCIHCIRALGECTNRNPLEFYAKAHVGVIRAKVNTLFGLKEDEAVLRGRARVY